MKPFTSHPFFCTLDCIEGCMRPYDHKLPGYISSYDNSIGKQAYMGIYSAYLGLEEVHMCRSSSKDQTSIMR